MLLSLYNDQPPSDFTSIQSKSLLDRLKAIDARAARKGLAALDATKNPLIRIGMEIDESGAVIKNGYGVFNLSWQAQQHPEWPGIIEQELEEIRRRIQDAHGVRLRFLIWAGMGGSAEDKHMYNAVGLLKGGPRCYVLDSTDPAKLKNIFEDISRRSRAGIADILRSTLVVGMAMGMTSYEPVINLEKLALLYEKHGIDSRPNFLYMTLPGSLLDQFASERGYRRVELQPDNRNSAAGRHSSPLTRGSLYPLGLSGVDLNVWMQATALTEEEIDTAWRLAAFLHSQGMAKRDKVTLILPKEWSGAALWTKQDFEESLGKSEDCGIKIAIDEKLCGPNYRAPREPLQDRVFLIIQVKGLTPVDAPKVTLLRRVGYPVAVVTLPRGSLLSHYMQLIHYVVFGIAYLREMNFVTQPGVELYKAIASRLHTEASRAGGIEKIQEWREMKQTPLQASWRRGITLYYGFGTTEPSNCLTAANNPKTAPEIYAALLRQLASTREAEYGELTFFGDTRYSPQGRSVRKSLNRGAEILFRSRLKMPVDVSEGPAMNHSYHEMIIGHGKCFSTVLISEAAESMPAIHHTADYHRAQFLATIAALSQRRRAVVAIALKDLEENTLASLDEFFRQTAKHV